MGNGKLRLGMGWGFTIAALICAPVVAFGQESPPEKKTPIPAQAQLDEALAAVRSIFQKEYAAAKSSPQQLALADKMLETARATTDDPAGQYILFRVARDICVKLGDIDRVQAIADEVEAAFAVEGVTYRLEGLAGVARAVNGPAKKAQVAQALAALIDEAVRHDQFPQATTALNEALLHAKSGNDKELPKRLAERQATLVKQQALYAAAKAAIDRGDDSDPAANLAAGKYYAFIKQDWALGLAMLGKSGDAALAAQAKADLAAPTDASEMAKVGDGWWTLSEQHPDLAAGMQARAAHWYREALPMLTGIAKFKAEQRLASLAESQAQSGVKRDPWFVLFRSGVPAIWNKDYTGQFGKAVALSKAPKGIKYLRMTAVAKEPATVIIEMTNERLAAKSLVGDVGWEGTGGNHHGGIHLGIYHRTMRILLKNGQPTITPADFSADYGGWGFGHVYGDDVQCLSWSGRAIPPGTVIEIAVSTEPLSKEEEKLLVK